RREVYCAPSSARACGAAGDFAGRFRPPLVERKSEPERTGKRRGSRQNGADSRRTAGIARTAAPRARTAPPGPPQLPHRPVAAARSSPRTTPAEWPFATTYPLPRVWTKKESGQILSAARAVCVCLDVTKTGIVRARLQGVLGRLYPTRLVVQSPIR